MFVLKQSPLASQHQHVAIKKPKLVKNFYLVKHGISAFCGLSVLYIVGIAKDPFLYPLMYMLLSLYIGIELISIYVNGKYV
jgi:hypothetical protein